MSFRLKSLIAGIMTLSLAIPGLILQNNPEKVSNVTTPSVVSAPEVKYITRIETVTVTEVVTEVVTEIRYDYIYPDDYEMIHDYYYNSEIDYEMHMAQLAEKYPAATQIWRALTEEYGLSKYVAAGIIGNMMNECGGNTLTLHPEWKVGNYYGLCMWSIKYSPQVSGKSLEYQIEYLMSNIETTFNQYGKLYKKNFTYTDFCNLTDVRDVSDAFMIVYERPGPSSKVTRRNNATYAYSIFVQ